MSKFRRVLVTGADGFIGSHLVEMLVREGYQVRAFVFYNSFNSWGWLDHCDIEIKGKFEVVSGDIRDSQCVKNAMVGCDAVIHLAALIAIPFSYVAPESYVETNIKGTLNVLKAARELEVKRLLHASTSEVYGTAQYVPIDENHPVIGQSPYSATKIGADQLVYSFFASFNLPAVIVRPFNTYGPRQSARAVIPTVISQIANGLSEIKIGSVLPTRDFSYVSDTCSGFISALKSEKGIGQTVNLGSNFEISVEESVKLIANLMNKQIRVVSDKERVRPNNSEVERLWSNNQKAQDLFDWKPEFIGIEGFKTGLEKTISWFTNMENLNRYKSSDYNI